MSKVLKLVNGVPRMIDTGEAVVLRSPNGSRHHLKVDNGGILQTETGTVYNETLVVGPGGVSTGTAISLPNSGNYLGEELEVRLNATLVTAGDEFDYVGSGVKTQVHFNFDLVNGDSIAFKKVV